MVLLMTYSKVHCITYFSAKIVIFGIQQSNEGSVYGTFFWHFDSTIC